MLLEMDGEVHNINVVKDIVLERLHTDKIITEKQLDEYRNNWHLIIVKNSWFKNAMNRLNLTNGKGYFYQFVKFNLLKNK